MNKTVVKTNTVRDGGCVLLSLTLCAALASVGAAQTRTAAPAAEQGRDQGRSEIRTRAEQTRLSTVTNAPRAETKDGRAAGPAKPGEAGDPFFAPIYRNFYNSYHLGPGDVLALRIAQQPEYTIERAKVSPVGRVFHPLLGDVEVGGLTVDQVLERFNRELGEYLIDPKVSIELVEANSAKIGVLGEVKAPGIIVMSGPMTVMDAIAAAGGFADTGSKSNVSLLRAAGGRLVETKINLKRVLDGKAALENDLTLRAGDTLIVRGNTRKKIGEISSMVGFAQFLTFLTRY